MVYKILCIDASLTSTGWAIFNEDKLTGYGKICPPEKNTRLLYIYNRIAGLLATNQINLILMENGFSKTSNLKAGLQLAELRGAIKVLALQNKIIVVEAAPQHVKKLNCGKGNATKEEIYEYLKTKYNGNAVFESIGEFSDRAGKNKTSDIYDAISLFAMFEEYKNLNE